MKRLPAKLLVFGTAMVVCCIVEQHAGAQVGSRSRSRINDNWRYRPGPLMPTGSPGNDASHNWQKVTLPHTWNVDDVLDDEPGYRRGLGFYRRQLMLDRRSQNKRIFLFFEGANQIATVSVNGREVGRHVGGYTGFSFEITDSVRFDGMNEIEVRVDNTHDKDIPPIDGDFNMYGGIYRDVWLIATDQIYLETTDIATDGITITTPTISPDTAVVEISGAVVNTTERVRNIAISTSIIDPRGRRIASLSSKMPVNPNARAEFKQASNAISDPMLWSPDHPDLYTVRIQIKDGNRVVDQISNPLGFRWFAFDAEKGFSLNGKHLKLRGTNRHQDHAGLGNAVPDRLHVRDLEIIKQNGFNFVRLAHYPQDPSVLDAADRLGLLIWEEIPIVNQIHVSEQFNENARTMLREMIRQHRNHPSIVIWGYMNEVFLPVPKTDAVIRATVELARQLEAICKEEDPTRATAIAFDWGARDLYNSSGLGDITQIVGWNLYHGWYYEKFEDFGRFLDDQHRRFPKRPLIVSEFGANGDRRVHSLTPKRFDSTIEWQRAFHEAYLPQIESRPFISGSAIWNQFDFGSEFRGETIPHINQKGMYTFDRRPKDISYLYRASYSDKPVMHIAVRDWPRRSGTRSQSIVVYTNQSRVEMFHDGVSIGVRNITGNRAEWNVRFHDGVNRLRAVAVGSPAITDRAGVIYESLPDTIAVNCGSHTEVVDSSGTIWQADISGEKHSWRLIEGRSKPFETRQNILGTIDDPIYQTMREGAAEYQFDVADGSYEIDVLSAEPKFKATGERVFDVVINGREAAGRQDPFSSAGFMRSSSRRVVGTVEGGTGLRISFVPVKNLPIVSGIRIRRIQSKGASR